MKPTVKSDNSLLTRKDPPGSISSSACQQALRKCRIFRRVERSRFEPSSRGNAHYTDDSSVRLIGILKYEDAEHHQYERPWCYQSVRPKGTDKPVFFPCWYMDRF